MIPRGTGYPKTYMVFPEPPATFVWDGKNSLKRTVLGLVQTPSSRSHVVSRLCVLWPREACPPPQNDPLMPSQCLVMRRITIPAELLHGPWLSMTLQGWAIYKMVMNFPHIQFNVPGEILSPCSLPSEDVWAQTVRNLPQALLTFPLPRRQSLKTREFKELRVFVSMYRGVHPIIYHDSFLNVSIILAENTLLMGPKKMISIHFQVLAVLFH